MIKEHVEETDFSELNSQNHFEGDILLINNTEGTQFSAVHENRLWPDASIPYIISDQYSI